MAAIPINRLILEIATDPTKTPNFHVWWGDALEILCRVPSPMTFEDITEAVCEIKLGGVTGETLQPVASIVENPDQESSEVLFAFDSDQMAQLPISGRTGQYWLVVTLLRATGQKMTFYGGQLSATRTNSTLQPTEQPPSSLLATSAALQAEVDARYNAVTRIDGEIAEIQDALAQVTGVETVSAPLDSFSDTRGALWAHCYDPSTGRLFIKVGISPHSWAAVQMVNS